MASERVILCGEVPRNHLPLNGETPLCLHLWGPQENIQLRIKDIQEHLLRDIPSQFHDLIEIAAYVYCADQAIARGGSGVENFGRDWRRKLFFRIPVRNPDLWNSLPLYDQLIETLSFLSEDEYHFEFTHLADEPPTQQCLNLDMPLPEEVMLYSGGLDSLAGAIQSAVIERHKTALIMHRPTEKLTKRHRKLEELLASRATHQPIHLPVTINKDKSLGREYSQRSRSFLYAALGSTVAQIFNLSKISFYENGIVSFNLPPSPQVVGARATRTTHPRVIKGYAKIFSILAGKEFKVETPFLWNTKAEILGIIKNAGCEEMIKFSTSCTHTWEMTKLHTHCGTCSQCIDRRFAVLAAGLEAHDPAEAYAVDLLIGGRDKGEDRTMLASYVETASEVCEMPATDFFGKFGEAARILRHINGSPDITALKLYELHKRHAKAVTEVVENSIVRFTREIRKRELPDSCLVRLVCDSLTPPLDFFDVPALVANPHRESRDYAFRKKGQFWSVRFAGSEEIILSPSKGAAYLHILLSNPRIEFRVVDLVLRVAKEPRDYLLQDGVNSTDRGALAAYSARYEELEEDLNEAIRLEEEGMSSLRSVSDIREERAALLQQIKRDTALGNQPRKIADDRDRVRKSFQAAIRRVMTEITKYDKRLADHLKPPRLRCGWSPCYNPNGEIDWDT